MPRSLLPELIIIPLWTRYAREPPSTAPVNFGQTNSLIVLSEQNGVRHVDHGEVAVSNVRHCIKRQSGNHTETSGELSEI